MKSIAWAIEKGGVGKTSLCFSVAWKLSEKKKVLLIDLDSQKANLSYFADVDKTGAGVQDVILGKCAAGDAIKPVRKHLDIIPTDFRIESLNSGSVSDKRLLAGFQGLLESDTVQAYDYVFIDVSPSPTKTHRLALACSDFCIIPVMPDVASLEALTGVLETVYQMQASSDPVRPAVLGVVINRFRSGTNLSKKSCAAIEEITEGEGIKLFKTIIRETVNLSELVLFHQGITEYKPKSRSSEDIESLTKEIVKEIRKRGKEDA